MMLLVCLIVIYQAVCQFTEQCYGQSDIIICLDGSGSVSSSNWLLERAFAGDIMNALRIDPQYVWGGLIQFGGPSGTCPNHGYALLEQRLTGNKALVTNKAYTMSQDRGWTPFHKCFLMAITEFRDHSRRLDEVMPFLIIITDGYDQRNTVATHPSLYAHAANFGALSGFIDTIKRITCADIYEITPNTLCSGSNHNVNVRGTGFLNVWQIKCRLQIGATSYLTNAVYNSETLNKGHSWTKGLKPILWIDCTQPLDPLDCLNPYIETCRGKTDIIFVLDTSFSVDNEEWGDLRDFTYETCAELCIDPDHQRIGVIEFTTDCYQGSYGEQAKNYVVLTDTREDVLRITRNIGRCGAGETPLHSGIRMAYDQINGMGDPQNMQPFVVVVSDGVTDSCMGLNAMAGSEAIATQCRNCLGGALPGDGKYWDCVPQCCYDDRTQRDLLLSTGALIFGIAVGATGDIDRDYVKYNISSHPNLYASADSFAQIQNIQTILIEKTCLDIYSMSPSYFCLGSTGNLIVRGTGFLNIPTLRCKVGSQIFTGQYVNDEEIECIMPSHSGFTTDTFYPIQVSINSGTTWAGEGVGIFYYDCTLNVTEELECAKPDLEVCRGKSDIVYVLDTSGSINSLEWVALREFTYNVTKKLCLDPVYQHVGIVEFTTNCDGGYATSKVDLTGEREETLRTVRTLDRCGSGYTPLHKGLQEAYSQFVQFGRPDAQKYVVVVSDGITDSCLGIPSGVTDQMATQCRSCISGYDPFDKKYWDCVPECCYDDREAVKTLHQMGVLIFGIVVGPDNEVDRPYVKYNISSYPVLYAQSNSFDEVKEVTTILVEKTCLDVYRLEPNNLCVGESKSIKVHGTGFFNGPMRCKVGPFEMKASYIDDFTAFCNITWTPLFEAEVFYNLEISFSSWSDQSWSVGEKPIMFYDCSDNGTDTLLCNCYGQTDIIFVLDNSFSIDNYEWNLLRDFTYNITTKLCLDEQYAHVSLVEFTTKRLCKRRMSDVVLNLGGNRLDILKTTRNLGRCGAGETPLHAGLERAYEQIIDNGRDFVYKYVIVVSDGVTDSCKLTNINCADLELHPLDPYNCTWDTYPEDACALDLAMIKKIEDTGAFVYSVAVGNEAAGDDIDVDYLKNNISTFTDFYAHAESFDEINSLIQRIIDSTCIDIFYIDPPIICRGDNFDLRVLGTGFVQILGGMYIRMELRDGTLKIYEAEYVSIKEMHKEINWDDSGMTSSGEYKIQVSIGGTFWSKSLYLVVDPCPSTSSFPRWIPISTAAGLLGLLCCMLLLALLLLLSLCILGTRKKPRAVQKADLKLTELNAPAPLPEPEPEPEPEPYLPPPRLDRSTYYIGGRAMTVDWSNSGAEYSQGLGASEDFQKKNQLYDEIRRRKMERRKRERNPGMKLGNEDMAFQESLGQFDDDRRAPYRSPSNWPGVNQPLVPKAEVTRGDLIDNYIPNKIAM